MPAASPIDIENNCPDNYVADIYRQQMEHYQSLRAELRHALVKKQNISFLPPTPSLSLPLQAPHSSNGLGARRPGRGEVWGKSILNT